jgi:tRNA A-37 threonylcarbamoyl transferase component Bud32/tetratricopeptide (TPR) repeat protein
VPLDASETSDPQLGRIIGERYRVLSPLGRGGMGAVYRVEHVMMKKEMALKLLHPELSRLEEVGKRFEREAEAAAKLDHPNIISVTDFGRTSDGQLFLVMELLNGRSLTDVIRPGGVGRPLPVARAIHILRQILRALEHAHAVGIVHRDLKPDNVMLVERDGEQDVVKLLDFGIAKMTITDGQQQSGTPKPETLTQAGIVFGTPEYLSPEQAMGEEADRRADLYSAGIVLYEMLTGKRPFEAASKVAVVSMHLTQKALPVTRAAPTAQIPPWLERVVERAMAKKRDERYASAQEFLQGLDGSGAISRPISVITQPFGLAKLARSVWQRVSERVGETWQFLVGRAREAGVPWPRAFVVAGFSLVAALLILVVAARRTDKPRPAPALLAESLARVEQLLARGELEPARAALQQLESAHPETARVHYLLGNLDYAQGERERALADYREALHLDPGYANDAVLRGNVRALVERKSEGPQAVALLADDVGKPALSDLVACAKTCRDERTRKKAAEAAIKLGGAALVAQEQAQTTDDKQAALDKLRLGRSCRERKAAALELIATGDKRYLDSLRAARERRGGFLNLQEINVCMRRDLDAAIRKWEIER